MIRVDVNDLSDYDAQLLYMKLRVELLTAIDDDLNSRRVCELWESIKLLRQRLGMKEDAAL